MQGRDRTSPGRKGIIKHIYLSIRIVTGYFFLSFVNSNPIEKILRSVAEDLLESCHIYLLD